MLPIARRDLVLLLLALHAGDDTGEGIGGITRLQKFLFLLDKEEGISPTDGFEFIPYKAGPYSSKLYDDLEFLENLGFIESKLAGEATEQESAELDLSFNDLMGPAELDCAADTPLGTADEYEERKFYVTEKGGARIERLLRDDNCREIAERVRKVTSKYGPYSLSELLYYVYTKYPESATESEIRDKVLRRRRRR